MVEIALITTIVSAKSHNIAFVRDQRGNQDFDVVHLAPPTPGNDPERARAIVAPYQEVGVSWWLERFTPDCFGSDWKGSWPYEAMVDRLVQGPPPLPAARA